MGQVETIAILEGFGASGIATIITTWITKRFSGDKQSTAEPNGVRTRLTEEVNFLRQQVVALGAAAAIERQHIQSRIAENAGKEKPDGSGAARPD